MHTRKRCLRWSDKITFFAAVAWLLFFSAYLAAAELSAVGASERAELLLPDLTGRARGLGELSGNVVLVNFWASWCTPCMEEMPSIQRLADAMRGKPFAVIGVNVGEAELRAKTVASRLGIGFLVLLDKDSALLDHWGATVLPTTYLLDGKGVVRCVARGPLQWDRPDLIELLDGLMAGGNPSSPAAGVRVSAPE